MLYVHERAFERLYLDTMNHLQFATASKLKDPLVFASNDCEKYPKCLFLVGQGSFKRYNIFFCFVSEEEGEKSHPKYYSVNIFYCMALFCIDFYTSVPSH